MISRFSCRLPIRLHKDAPNLPIPSVLNPIRQASTSSPKDDPNPTTSSYKFSRKALLYRSRIPTNQEIAYNARKKADGRRARPLQIDPYTRRLMDTRLAAIKARHSPTHINNNTTASNASEDTNVLQGNPVHGSCPETPFLQSLALGMATDQIHIPNQDGIPSRAPEPVNTRLTDHTAILSSANTGVAQPEQLAHFLSSAELSRFGRLSAALSKPPLSDKRTAIDPDAERKRTQQHAEDHATRMAALARITAVENLSSAGRASLNTRRIVGEFGRHVTDDTIDPRQNVRRPHHGEDWLPKQRIGPDTGSSEVQIALLTAKIKLLAAAYEGPARKDKANKRNLRLLLHRRQKLLAYFYKRDRGGERWQHMVEKLGVTPAMWKGEIELR